MSVHDSRSHVQKGCCTIQLHEIPSLKCVENLRVNLASARTSLRYNALKEVSLKIRAVQQLDGVPKASKVLQDVLSALSQVKWKVMRGGVRLHNRLLIDSDRAGSGGSRSLLEKHFCKELALNIVRSLHS